MPADEIFTRLDQYVQRLIAESTPERTVWNVEKLRQGVPADWNYIDGCMMTALLSLYEITGEQRYFSFVESFIDSFISEDGEIRTFHPEKQTLDDINEGRVLFPLYEATGKEKYRRAAELLRRALDRQPRTAEGSWWHKRIYPNQVWLDGSISEPGITGISSARSEPSGNACGTKKPACIITATTPPVRLSGATGKPGSAGASGSGPSAGSPSPSRISAKFCRRRRPLRCAGFSLS